MGPGDEGPTGHAGTPQGLIDQLDAPAANPSQHTHLHVNMYEHDG